MAGTVCPEPASAGSYPAPCRAGTDARRGYLEDPTWPLRSITGLEEPVTCAESFLAVQIVRCSRRPAGVHRTTVSLVLSGEVLGKGKTPAAGVLRASDGWHAVGTTPRPRWLLPLLSFICPRSHSVPQAGTLRNLCPVPFSSCPQLLRVDRPGRGADSSVTTGMALGGVWLLNAGCHGCALLRGAPRCTCAVTAALVQPHRCPMAVVPPAHARGVRGAGGATAHPSSSASTRVWVLTEACFPWLTA